MTDQDSGSRESIGPVHSARRASTSGDELRIEDDCDDVID